MSDDPTADEDAARLQTAIEAVIKDPDVQKLLAEGYKLEQTRMRNGDAQIRISDY